MKEEKFYEFTKQLKDKLYEKYGRDVKIDIHETVKNNGAIYNAVAIMEKECNISPNVRLDDFYQNFLQGSSMEEIVKEIIEIYEAGKREKIDISFFTDFSEAKHHILFKVIGYDKNKSRLQKIPHIKFLDLALTFYFYMNLQEFPTGNASIQIENEHLKLWKVDEGTLFDLAMKNTIEQMPIRFSSVYDVILNMMSREGICMNKNNEEEFRGQSMDAPMYVLSNRKNYFGASVIYYPGVLQKISRQMNKDLIVLPSSIHEVILIPVNGNENYEEINRMISDINREEVAGEEVLSEHLYYYDRKLDELQIPMF